MKNRILSPLRVMLSSILFVGAHLLSSVAHAEETIVLGQSAALTGPAAALGTGMQVGMTAYFNDLNEAGGIHGKQVSLISKDDGYEPEKAVLNTRSLIEEEKVFALIGAVGTPTSKAVLPVVMEAGVPFVGPFTGAGLLREPYNPLIVNVRGSYGQEMERLVQYLHNEKGYSKIAIFYQNDAYGKAGLSGLNKALESRGLALAGEGTYERNTTAVKRGVMSLKKASPEAIVMVGAYKACAEFIKVAKKFGMADVVYCNISFVGTRALQKELGEAGEGTVISQVVPDPSSSDTAVVVEYRESLAKHFPEEQPDWISLEGYLVAKLFHQIASLVEGELTREGFVQKVKEVGTFDLGGVVLSFGENDSQGMDDVFLTKISGADVLGL